MQVGRYRILRRIGRGGMAEVFEAVALGEAGFQRRVALKRILPDHAADPRFARMFLDEAQIASRLHHANVVSVLDFGVADGVPFQVLEFVDGISAGQLRRRCTSQGVSFPAEVALYVAIQVARALHHAHTALDEGGHPLGIVHRDVTPANILVSWDGDVRLVDFGIAFAAERLERTAAGTAKGTFIYMSPEQGTGDSIDGRSDVFALGCVLHALVAGTSPLAGEDRLLRLLQGTPLPLDPAIPPDIAPIVARALALSRHDRYASAHDLAEALGVALARRLDRDPRGLVCDLLEHVREASERRHPTPQPAVGLLDGFLAVDLVLEPGAGGERRFATREITAESEPFTSPSRPTDAEASTRAEAPSARRRQRTSRRGLVAATLLIAAAGAGAVVVGLRLADDEDVAPSVSPPALLATAAADAAPRPAGGAANAGDTPAATTAPADAAPPSKAVGPRSPARRDRTREATARPAAQEPRSSPPATAAREVGTGYLVISGAGALDLKIQVDGTPRGRAPKRLELPFGPHHVVLQDDRGETRADRRIEITSGHTPRSPFTLRLEAPPDG